VNLQPGGVAVGSGVGDEGYSTFVYAPGVRKAPVWGKYRGRLAVAGPSQSSRLAEWFRWGVSMAFDHESGFTLTGRRDPS